MSTIINFLTGLLRIQDYYFPGGTKRLTKRVTCSAYYLSLDSDLELGEVVELLLEAKSDNRLLGGGKSATDSTGLLVTNSNRLSGLALVRDAKSLTLLVGDNGESTSDVLADDLDLGELVSTTLTRNLSNAELEKLGTHSVELILNLLLRLSTELLSLYLA